MFYLMLSLIYSPIYLWILHFEKLYGFRFRLKYRRSRIRVFEPVVLPIDLKNFKKILWVNPICLGWRRRWYAEARNYWWKNDHQTAAFQICQGRISKGSQSCDWSIAHSSLIGRELYWFVISLKTHQSIQWFTIRKKRHRIQKIQDENHWSIAGNSKILLKSKNGWKMD